MCPIIFIFSQSSRAPFQSKLSFLCSWFTAIPSCIPTATVILFQSLLHTTAFVIFSKHNDKTSYHSAHGIHGLSLPVCPASLSRAPHFPCSNFHASHSPCSLPPPLSIWFPSELSSPLEFSSSVFSRNPPGPAGSPRTKNLFVALITATLGNLIT